MLKRKMLDKLIAWKQKAGGREALLIEGARRVGKSTIVEEFGRTQYKSYILIDFTRLPRDVRDIFENQRDDFDTFFMLLSAYYRKRLYERESLIIFDEVQRYPAARELIKYLVADGRYDYVETGSLISIKRNVANIVIPSEERKMDMGPLDFEEFCWAMGEELLAETIRKSFERLVPLPDALHKRAMRLWREYLLVGGMPQAVADYVEQRIADRHDDIVADKIAIDLRQSRLAADDEAAGCELICIVIFGNNFLKFGFHFCFLPSSIKEQRQPCCREPSAGHLPDTRPRGRAYKYRLRAAA